jgi:hypothetical protein
LYVVLLSFLFPFTNVLKHTDLRIHILIGFWLKWILKYRWVLFEAWPHLALALVRLHQILLLFPKVPMLICLMPFRLPITGSAAILLHQWQSLLHGVFSPQSIRWPDKQVSVVVLLLLHHIMVTHHLWRVVLFDFDQTFWWCFFLGLSVVLPGLAYLVCNFTLL